MTTGATKTGAGLPLAIVACGLTFLAGVLLAPQPHPKPHAVASGVKASGGPTGPVLPPGRSAALLRLPARLVHLVDGDTCDLEVERGLATRSRVRCRVLGIDTPERGDPRFAAATAAAGAWFAAQAETWVETTDQLDRSRRWLVNVYGRTPAGETSSLADHLLATGHAVPFR